MLLDVIWYGVVLIAAGLIFLETPEWLRSMYVRAAKGRGATPLKRPEWQAREARIGKVFVAAGVLIVVVRFALSGLAVDVIASLVFFVMVLWRVFSFIGD
ncbi:MAG: hypothetical protein GXY36_02455 [Chloroflexi bacterium]|nr:hypothetical protein [Chloroflexota bacterium]